eukprot:5927902-Pyramimonas_sp.AAC.1
MGHTIVKPPGLDNGIRVSTCAPGATPTGMATTPGTISRWTPLGSLPLGTTCSSWQTWRQAKRAVGGRTRQPLHTAPRLRKLHTSRGQWPSGRLPTEIPER